MKPKKGVHVESENSIVVAAKKSNDLMVWVISRSYIEFRQVCFFLYFNSSPGVWPAHFNSAFE